MRLALIRHGQAQPHAARDELRALADLGLQQAQDLVKKLELIQWDSVKIYSSFYLRAQQTAQPLASALGLDIQLSSSLIPETAPELALASFRQATQDIILFTHLPLVGRLASLLITGEDRDLYLDPAECWILEGEVIARGCMSLAARYY